jgi:signal transduction histidine kinase
VSLASSVLQSGFEGLSWSPRVTDRDRAAFEAAARVERKADYVIRELMPDRSFAMAPHRQEYFPIRYVDPERATSPIGLDLQSGKVSSAALQQAFTTGTAAATPLIHLPSGGEGTLLFVPVYPTSTNGNNRAAPVGVLTYRLSISAAFNTVIAAFEPVSEGLDLYVLDDAAPRGKRLIYNRPAFAASAGGGPADEAIALAKPYWGSSFQFAGRDCTLILRASPQLIANRLGNPGWVELTGGFLLTGLLTLYLVSTRIRADRLRHLADTLQHEVAVRRNTEHELKDARDQAVVASQAKSEFLANMSHELRTPLNAIIGFSEVISSVVYGPVHARYRDYANDIHNAGHHLLRIINEILDLSKVEAGQLELYDILVPIAEIFESCRRMMADRAATAGVVLDFKRTDLEVRGDGQRLGQVLLNLVSNAVKFTPTGGSVAVSARLTALGEVAITVTDTGIGMDAKEIPRALQPFGQIESVLTRTQGGTGLGLPLALRLVELHGGEMTIESARGAGTTVTFTLPPERTRKPGMAATETAWP